jgi:cytoskeletal protein CcmA (bactofilin family)
MAAMALRNRTATPPESIVSIIGPEMVVEGNCHTRGSLRVEGEVLGNISAGKGIYLGASGRVQGAIETQDAVIAGTLQGSIHAASRLELHATAQIDGDIVTRRIRIDEGASLNGQVKIVQSAPAGVENATEPLHA